MVASSERGEGSGAKLGLSGQKPVSMSPTMMPLPAFASPPNCFFHTPAAPVRPTKSGVGGVSMVTVRFLKTAITPGACCSFCAWAAVRFTATPLKVAAYWYTAFAGSTLLLRSTLVWVDFRWSP